MNNELNISTLFNKGRQSIKTNNSFLSPNSKLSTGRSPRSSAYKKDPAKIVTEYENNIAQDTLNLSSCNL